MNVNRVMAGVARRLDKYVEKWATAGGSGSAFVEAADERDKLLDYIRNALNEARFPGSDSGSEKGVKP